MKDEGGSTGAEDIPVLETKRLILRGLRFVDASAIQDAFSDYAIVRYLAATVPWPYPADGAARFLEQTLPRQGQDFWIWGLFLKSAPQALIGVIELRRAPQGDHRGFWLARAYWGRGLMTEAVAAVTALAFNVLGFTRLEFANAPANAGSRRIKEKQGARFLRLEPARYVDPEITAHEVWELTREDWQARQV